MEALTFDDGEYYDICLQEFRKKTDELAKDKEILNLHLPSAVKKIVQCAHHQTQFNVLSIGCGDGEMDLYVVDVIKRELQRHESYKNTKIFCRAFDPNSYAVSQYKAKIKESCNDDQTVFDVFKKTFEDYKLRDKNSSESSRPEEEMKFDVVLFIHSIYYVDLEEILAYCFEKELGENGQIVCLIEGRDLMSSVLSNCIPVLQGGKPAPDESFAEKVAKIAEKRGLKVECHMQEYSIDVTDVFDKNSREGNLLLDFLTQIKNFRVTAEHEIVEEMLQVIGESSQVMENGRRLGSKVDGIMFIYK